MTRLVALRIFVVLLLASVAGFAQELSGQWLMERTGPANSKVELTLRHERESRSGFSFSNYEESFDVQGSQLKGLDATVLASGGTKANFELVRDAGVFKCEGWFANGQGSGHYAFEPSATYRAALQQRGVGAPDAQQQLQLAMSDASLEFVDTLKSAGYSFDVGELLRAVTHGVDAKYVKAMNDLGYKPATIEGLVRMRDHGVDPEYVRQLKAAGLGGLPEQEIVKMRDHGVDAEYIHGLDKYGIKGLSGMELARLRDHGVDPEFIASMKSAGLLGGAQASTDELVRLRDHGVDSEFVKDVHGAGYGNVSAEQLVRLRDHGVDADFLRQYGKGRSVEEVIRMKDTGLRAEM